MWFRKRNLKNKNIEMKKEQFGKVLLSGMLLTSIGNPQKQLEEMSINGIFFNYLTLLAYLLFLTRKTLENKFSPNDAEIIVDATIDGLFDYMDCVPENKKQDANKLFREIYFSTNSYLDCICDDISSEDSFKVLVKSFLEDCDSEEDSHNYFSAFLFFSNFIIHYTDHILGSDIVIV